MAGPPPAHTEFAVGETLDVGGLTITLDQDSAGVDVLVEIVDLATGLTVETLLDDAKDFAADVARDLADLGASNYLCDTAGEFALRRGVSGGSPAVESESSDYGFVVSGAVTYPAAPDITVARLTDTSARVTIDGDAGVTNYVLYCTEADGGDNWLDGGHRTGDGTVDITGLTAGVGYLIAVYSEDATGGRSFGNVVEYAAVAAGVLITPQEALVYLLKANTRYMALCAGRLYPDLAPQSAAALGPYSTYHQPAGRPEHHLKGPSGLRFVTLQLNHVGRTEAEADALADACRLALDGRIGDVVDGSGGTLTAARFILAEEHDEFDNPIAGKGRGVHRTIQDWHVSYNESLPL